ncbi:hypothetical protein [Acidobacterium sp. S8]|uniref:hypothetical protein n=1 Tax=Acidobacterium sp. S8 TaxID=1641854 RepID=UPI00131DF2BF|nr:hypothetical protein [Acidobacterium sp. S8]
MFSRIYLSLFLLAAIPVQSQVAPSATGAAAGDASMQTPPPVSDDSYPTEVGAETRSNYLNAGLTVTSGYVSNVAVGASEKPVGDMASSIRPTISLDQTTSRLHQAFTYSPGFTFYNKTSELNQADQDLAANMQYRFSPHITGSVHEEFRKSSNAFSYGIDPSGVSGSAQTPQSAIVAPVGDQLTNVTSAQLTYQYSRNEMLGGSGIFSILRYGDSSQLPGFSDSDWKSGSAFYSRRLSTGQYLGATYQYSNIVASSPVSLNGVNTTVEGTTQTQSMLFFFTTYFNRSVSLSVSGGPQHSDITQAPLPDEKSWSPAVLTSLGWQTRHTSLAAGYTHVTTAGGGLMGAYHADSANLAARWQLSRTWTFAASGSYMNTSNISKAVESSNPSGHTLTGTISAQHPLGEKFRMELGYTRLHQSYDSIAYIANTPDVSHVYFSLSYQFTKPLGR